MEKIKIDCLYYKGSKPCVFHKKEGAVCYNCSYYQPINKRILVIKLEALGDVLRTTSILPALNLKYPNSAISWITRKNAVSLLKNNDLIYRLLTVEDNYLEYILNEKFDIGICLDADSLSASILNIVNVNEKYGFITDEFGKVMPANELSYDWYFMGLNDKAKRENRKTYFEHIYKMCNLDGHYFKPQYSLTYAQKLFKEEFLEKNKINNNGKLIGINTGGGKRWQLKKWTIEKYISFIKIWKNKYPNDNLLLYGGIEEIEFNSKIKTEVGELVIDTGNTNTLFEFASLITLSDIFITPDSLGMHFSISLNIPTIVIVGPTSPWELDVFNNGEILYSDLNCISCYLSKCDKIINCMNSITIEKLINHVEKNLKRS